MITREPHQILKEILSISENNDFLRYITARIQRDNYRGGHVSQHNRFDLDVMKTVLQKIREVVGDDDFKIPPGDYSGESRLSGDFQEFQTIVDKINAEIGRGTINSIKKTFFPDLENMGFLKRERKADMGRQSYGRLTLSAKEFIEADTLFDRYKKYTDGIDKMFGSKISELAEMIYLSDYAHDMITIEEFMFIFSDENEDLDKIKLLDSYRELEKYERNKVIELVKEYANPKNFIGPKTSMRDFHNWKNEAQQIMSLLKTTVYFDVNQHKSFCLNVGSVGFFEGAKRSNIAKREYFNSHQIQKRDGFELHHIVPISCARNKKEAKLINNYLNLIYIHKNKHKVISRKGNKKVVLDIDLAMAVFSNIECTERVEAINEEDALYTKELNKIKKMKKCNMDLLHSIFDFPK